MSLSDTTKSLARRVCQWLSVITWLCAIGQDAMAEPVSITALLISAAISTAASVGLSYVAALLSPKPKPIEVNKSDQRIQTSEYGQVIPRIRGTVGQVAGQVIDAFPIPFKQTVTRIPGQGGKRKTPDQINYSYSVTLAVLICENQIRGVTKILLDTDVFYTGSATGSEVEATPAGCSGMHIYLGTESQNPDPHFEAEYGTGEVSAYRGYAYVVIRDLVLDKYSNRIPQIMFTVEADDGSVDEIVAAEMQLAGLTSDDYDLTDLAGLSIGGLFIGQQASIRQTVLEPISQALFADFIEIDGKITAVRRGRDSEATIPLAHLGAYNYDEAANGDKPPKTTLARKPDQEIPRVVDVVYSDSGRDYERNTQSYSRTIFESYERQTIAATGAMAMTANEASKIAKIQAVANWTEREPWQFSLPPQYLRFTPGTVFTAQTKAGRSVDVIIEKMSLGIPKGVIQVTGRSFLKEAYEQTGEGEVGINGSGSGNGGYVAGSGYVDVVAVPYDTLLKFSPLDGLIPQYAGVRGFYVWVTIDPADTRDEARWGGVAVYQDVSGAGTLRAVASQAVPSIFGTAHTTLAAGSGVDTVNTLDVNLEYGTLASITSDDFDAARPLNLFVVGDEVIQARDITRPDPTNYPKRYRLAHLRRGLRGTSGASGSHSPSEDVMAIDGALSFIPVPIEQANVALGYYAAGVNQDPLDTTRWDFTYEQSAPSYSEYFTIGDGSSTSFTLTHALNTTSVSVTFFDTVNGYTTYESWSVIDANNIQVDFSVAPSTSQFTATVTAV